MINVKRGGLGKVPNRRTFYLSTDGYVRDGYIDSMKEKIDSILSGHVKTVGCFLLL